MLAKNKNDIDKEADKLFFAPEIGKWGAPAEWLETNGLGGWASSSIIGCNTRRYHGLLVASIKPPAERVNLVSKLDDAIIINDKRFELGCNKYSPATIHPKGYEYLESFTKHLFPEWIYKAGGVTIKKNICMLYHENTTLIVYEILEAPHAISLELLPLVSAKDYHSLQHDYNNIWCDIQFENSIFKNKPRENMPDIFISAPGATYRHDPKWFNNFNYPVEIYRGLDFEEDLFNHGVFTVELKKADQLCIIVSTENPAGRNAWELFEKEKRRRDKIILPYKDETLQQLVLAADQFIVNRGDKLKTVIAGYHWFTDWGRDTMIALPGLCLSTRRFEDAKKIIAAFAQSVSMGMLPNRFRDNNAPPEYNNADGTLWYFIAIKKYLKATGDIEFILIEILPVLKNIIDWHFKGTRYNIHVDKDGLLYAGEKGQQLTWMDARIGEWVVTPRTGKPVEIQALWYNALKIFAELLILNKQDNDAAMVELSAMNAKESFEKLFWFKKGKYLYDVIDENGKPDKSLRPNQLIALSLPFTILDDKEKAQAILQSVEEKLYTPVGLRSLSSDDERYIPYYGGDQWHRDSSYHMGTVWSWLLGPFFEAIIKYDTVNGRQKVHLYLDAFKFHLNEGCIGNIAEIADADTPHFPRGCVAQAWGVAELLRIITDFAFS